MNQKRPFNINIPSDYFWSAGRAGRFGLGDDWQIRLRGRIRVGLCGCKEDTDCCKILWLLKNSFSEKCSKKLCATMPYKRRSQFSGHFLSPDLVRFTRNGTFSTATPDCNS